MFHLKPAIERRKLNDFVDLLQIQILTDSNVKKEDRMSAINATNEMRGQNGTTDTTLDRKFDRTKFEALRGAMGRKKGRAPARAG